MNLSLKRNKFPFDHVQYYQFKNVYQLWWQLPSLDFMPPQGPKLIATKYWSKALSTENGPQQQIIVL